MLALEITFHLEKQNKVSLGDETRCIYLSVDSKTCETSGLAVLSCHRQGGVSALRCVFT